MPANRPFSPFRHLLQPLLAAALIASASVSFAAAPLQMTQAPGYYRMAVGSYEITALYEGAIDLDSALLKNIDENELRALLARKFLKGPAVQTAVNAYLINTGNKLVLVDAGAAKLFGPSLGHIADNLRAAGYQPEQVDLVLVTHLHGDHVNGLLTADGQPAFPNAEVWSAQADNDYWLSEEVAAAAPDGAKPFFKMARDAAAPYLAAGKWHTFASDRDIIPGITAIAAHGHTPGHSAYLVKDGEEHLLIWGDLVHNHAVQFARPVVSIEFDVAPAKAVAARLALFARAADERLMVAGMHLPFPGMGHVRRKQEGYAWVPVEFAPLPAKP
jgi:glyoxylase-like metal-dependent hydrolase (beta-lactamase superfamily II)